MRYIKDYWLAVVLFVGTALWFGWLLSWWAAVPLALLAWGMAGGLVLWAGNGAWR